MDYCSSWYEIQQAEAEERRGMPFSGNINSLVTRLSLEPHKSKTGKQDKKEKGKEKDFGSPVVP